MRTRSIMGGGVAAALEVREKKLLNSKCENNMQKEKTRKRCFVKIGFEY